jgi:hypothetical protein
MKSRVLVAEELGGREHAIAWRDTAQARCRAA